MSLGEMILQFSMSISERFELNKQICKWSRDVLLVASNSASKDIGTSLGSRNTIGWPSRGPGFPLSTNFCN